MATLLRPFGVRIEDVQLYTCAKPQQAHYDVPLFDLRKIGWCFNSLSESKYCGCWRNPVMMSARILPLELVLVPELTKGYVQTWWPGKSTKCERGLSNLHTHRCRTKRSLIEITVLIVFLAGVDVL